MGGIPMRPDFIEIDRMPVGVETTISETLMHVNGCQAETIQILRESVARLYGENTEVPRPAREVNNIREEISEILTSAQDIEKLAREIFRRL